MTRVAFALLVTSLASLASLAACTAADDPAVVDAPVDGGVTPDGPEVPVDVPLPLTLIVQTPTGERALTTLTDHVSVHGLAWGPVEQVRYETSDGLTGELAGTATWSGEVAITPSTRAITITATGGGTERSEILEVIRNRQLEVRSHLEVEPDVLLTGDAVDAYARIALAGPVDPAAVALVRVDLDGTRTPIALLADDGAGPDEQAGDRVYVARFQLAEAAPVQFDLVVEALPRDAAEPDRSPSHRVAVYAPYADDDLVTRDALLARAHQTFTEHFDGEASRSAAIDAVVADLRAQAGVRWVARADVSVSFRLDSELLGVVVLAPPDTKAAPGAPRCRYVRILSMFFFQFAPQVPAPYVTDFLQDRLLAASCRDHFIVDHQKSTDRYEIGLAAFRGLGSQDVIYLDTHGVALRLDDGAGNPSDHELLLLPLADCPATGPCSPALDPVLKRQLQALARDGQVAYGSTTVNFSNGTTGQYYAVALMARFFAKRGPYRGALVIADACQSLQVGELGATFLAAGAAAYLGWTAVATVPQSKRVMSTVFTCLLTPDETLGACHARVKNQLGPFGARLALAPGSDASYALCPRP